MKNIIRELTCVGICITVTTAMIVVSAYEMTSIGHSLANAAGYTDTTLTMYYWHWIVPSYYKFIVQTIVLIVEIYVYRIIAESERYFNDDSEEA